MCTIIKKGDKPRIAEKDIFFNKEIYDETTPEGKIRLKSMFCTFHWYAKDDRAILKVEEEDGETVVTEGFHGTFENDYEFGCNTVCKIPKGSKYYLSRNGKLVVTERMMIVSYEGIPVEELNIEWNPYLEKQDEYISNIDMIKERVHE